jgi:hypothetical protein
MTIKHESLRDCSRQQLEFPAHDNLSCSNPCCKFLRSNGRASILVSECKYSLVYPATCRHNGIFDSMQNAIRARSHKMRSSRGAAQPCHERPAATDSDSFMIRIGCFRTGVSSSWSFAARYTASRNVLAKTRCMRQAI